MRIPNDLTMDPWDIERRGILRTDDTGKICSRLGILASIYFMDGWRAEKRQALLSCLSDYLARFGEHITHYQIGGERRLRRWNGKGLPESYSDMINLKEEDLFFYRMKRLEAGEDMDPSLWMILSFGQAKGNKARPISGLKIHVSPGYVSDNVDAFIEMVRSWSEWLGAVHGSVGLGALSVPGTELTGDACYYPWLIQYPALEYDAMGDYFGESKGGGYERPRSSNWLTVLGSDNLAALGGMDKVRSQFSPGMSLVPYGGGVVIRACPLPVLGNAETGGIPEGYRNIARIIRPIRFEGYQWGVIKEPFPVEGPETTLRWIRRFDEASQ